MTVRLRYAVASDVGLAREINEDAAYAGPHLLAVADGMGGHAAGEVASAATIAALATLDRELDDAGGALRRAIAAANQTLRDMVSADGDLRGMGTTATAAVIDHDTLVFAHVGDSRAYFLRDGVLTQLTHDHTFVQQLVDEGRIAADEAGTHPQRSIITRALDGREGVLPDVFIQDTQPGDRFLLCSDGLSSVVSHDELAEALGRGSPHDAAQLLIDLALRGGGPDNITCVVADVVGDGAADTTPVVAGAADDVPPAAAPAAGRAATTTISTSSVDPPSVPEGPASPLAARPNLPLLRSAGPRERTRRIRRRRAVLTAVVTAVLLVVGAGAGWAYIRSQYYVGVDDDHVAIYRGVSGQLLGLELSEVHERTPLAVGMLPEFAREDVRAGISAASLDHAQRIVGRLRENAGAAGCVPATPSPSPSPVTTTLPRATASPAPRVTPTPCPLPTVTP